MEEHIETTAEGLLLPVHISFAQGLHARPAARLVREAQRYTSDIHLLYNGIRADAKSILDILSLAASQGSRLHILAKGPDAREALQGMAAIFSGDA